MSPTPTIPKPIKITITSGLKGQPITIYNRTTGDRENTTLFGTAKAQYDLANFTNGYTAGDVIEFSVAGVRIGHNTLTTSGDKGESVTIATTAIATGIARGI